MAELDSQIAQVHSQLVELAQKRNDLKAKINQRHDPFIHHLPVELSSKIFLHYVRRVYGTFNPREAAYRKFKRDWAPALFLSSICSTWRKIAFATSQLWRTIKIPLMQDDPDVDLKIKLLNDCVDRAGQRTLFIGVFQLQLYDSPHFSQLEDKLESLIPLFAAIKEVARRSKKLDLWGLPPLPLEYIIPTDAPNLNAVKIEEAFREYEEDDDESDSDYGGGPIGWNDGDICLAGPRLRNLTFRSGAGALLKFTQIKWKTVKTITMRATRITVQEALDILRQASRLISCSLAFDNTGAHTSITPPIINSTLKKLRIDSGSRLNSLEMFVNSVTLPSLLDFSLQTRILPDMQPLFDRSQCQVQTLSLTLQGNVPEEHVLRLLRNLPSVEHFDLDIHTHTREPVTNKFFEAFRDPRFASTGASADPLLPQLTSFSYIGAMHFTWPALLEMFGDVAVHPAGRPLSKVSLKLDLPKGIIGDLDVVARFRQIQQSEIKLVVTDLEGKDLLSASNPEQCVEDQI
ncbi:hypothetical protein M413DRAFT_31740 [Hebeloma cylindrosporum]|uniref:Uncharacterized protein n=1 Tax=Hebeloma cylindrosporum TaxID=76867 RepID=A0A0C3BW56_HEBCY|nr:hypothetical protein M413DRAFT_31740 [Hebeloma cylindrosporum h7]